MANPECTEFQLALTTASERSHSQPDALARLEAAISEIQGPEFFRTPGSRFRRVRELVVP